MTDCIYIHTFMNVQKVICAWSVIAASVWAARRAMSEHDIMIISCNLGYCHGGMNACQGYVRTDTKSEQINRSISFSPTAGTERKKEEKEEMEQVPKKSCRNLKGGKANSTWRRVHYACNCLPPTDSVSITLRWLESCCWHCRTTTMREETMIPEIHAAVRHTQRSAQLI